MSSVSGVDSHERLLSEDEDEACRDETRTFISVLRLKVMLLVFIFAFCLLSFLLIGLWVEHV